MPRNKAFRRHQIYRHMWRRLKEDRNQHYDDLTCPCWTDKRVMAKFKEQPKLCSCWICSQDKRKISGPTIQELRHYRLIIEDLKEDDLSINF